MTHYSTGALAALLFDAEPGAFASSNPSEQVVAGTTLGLRIGMSKPRALERSSSKTPEPGQKQKLRASEGATGGYMSRPGLNKAYEDTDVMVSLAKSKNHITAGVTLSMKNQSG